MKNNTPMSATAIQLKHDLNKTWAKFVRSTEAYKEALNSTLDFEIHSYRAISPGDVESRIIHPAFSSGQVSNQLEQNNDYRKLITDNIISILSRPGMVTSLPLVKDVKRAIGQNYEEGEWTPGTVIDHAWELLGSDCPDTEARSELKRTMEDGLFKRTYESPHCGVSGLSDRSSREVANTLIALTHAAGRLGYTEVHRDLDKYFEDNRPGSLTLFTTANKSHKIGEAFSFTVTKNSFTITPSPGFDELLDKWCDNELHTGHEPGM